MNALEKKHLGIIQTLIEEFEKHRLPRLLRLQDKVDSGAPINDVEMDFLCQVIEDANRTMPLTVNDPELHEFCLCVVHLYHDISTKALENEKKIHH